MKHPDRQTGLFEIGETEIPAQILRVDHIADAKSNRLSPGYDLTAREPGQRTLRRFPKGIADAIPVVYFRLAFVIDKIRPCYIARFPRIGWLVNQPEAYKKLIVGIE